MVRRGERLTHFAQAAVAIAAVNLAVVTLFTLLGDRDSTGSSSLPARAWPPRWGVPSPRSARSSSSATLFGITTSFQLLELANPSQPLLRRLQLETTGHVPPLADGRQPRRARRGGDRRGPAVARVAAYYHDIGKLANPAAFIENQTGGENIHDELEPEQSVALLKDHVASGIDLAYQYRLPQADRSPSSRSTTARR